MAVYRLRYGWERACCCQCGRSIAGVHLPGLLEADGEAAGKLGQAQVEQLDELLRGKPVFAPRLRWSKLDDEHRVSVSTDYLAMGRYGMTVAAMGCSARGLRWQSWLPSWPCKTSDVPAVDFAPLWQAMPNAPAACVAVPVSQDVGLPYLANSVLRSRFHRLGGAVRWPGGAVLVCRTRACTRRCW